MSDIHTMARNLRAIATELEESPRHCLLWADLKGSNDIHAKVASGYIHSAIRKGMLPGVSGPVASAYVQRPAGRIDWRLIRRALGFDLTAGGDTWITEFDDIDPPKRYTRLSIVLRNPFAENESDIDDEPGADSELQAELPQSSTDRLIEDDRTADELRAWYKQQSMVWSIMFKMIADKIESGITETIGKSDFAKIILRDDKKHIDAATVTNWISEGLPVIRDENNREVVNKKAGIAWVKLNRPKYQVSE